MKNTLASMNARNAHATARQLLTAGAADVSALAWRQGHQAFQAICKIAGHSLCNKFDAQFDDFTPVDVDNTIRCIPKTHLMPCACSPRPALQLLAQLPCAAAAVPPANVISSVLRLAVA